MSVCSVGILLDSSSFLFAREWVGDVLVGKQVRGYPVQKGPDKNSLFFMYQRPLYLIHGVSETDWHLNLFFSMK